MTTQQIVPSHPELSLRTTSRCRLCGQPVGDRDYAATWPFDSECDCRSPIAPLVVPQETPDERWWARQREALQEIIAEAAPAERQPPAPHRDGLLAGGPPIEPRVWAGVRVR